MNNKIKFLQIVLSDLISKRDTLELDLNRVLNDDNLRTEDKKTDFDLLLSSITVTNNKIQMLSEYMSAFNNVDTNNKNKLKWNCTNN
jgi:hypothetical protein